MSTLQSMGEPGILRWHYLVGHCWRGRSVAVIRERGGVPWPADSGHAGAGFRAAG